MNDAHLHLVVNHLPIIFPLVAALVMITGLLARSVAIQRTAFMIFAIGSLTAILAMSTGEGAEEIVENLSGVTEDYIEAHEEAAERFAALSYVLGGLSLVGLLASLKRRSLSSFIAIGVLVVSFVVLFFAQQAGTTGGEIRHTEIRAEKVAGASQAPDRSHGASGEAK
jgi:uncharacterized membrane protein